MADQSTHPAVGSIFRGVLVPDPRIDGLWEAQSTYTQAGPRSGVPEPQTASDMILESSGSQQADAEVVIRTHRAGMPRPRGGGFVWKQEADAATLYRGCDVYNVITGWKGLVWTFGSGDPYSADQAGAIALSTGEIVCAYRRQTGSGPTVHAVYVAKRAPLTGAWTHVLVKAYAADRESHPCLVELPDGRLLCFSMIYDNTAEEINVQAHVSDDQGDTWSFWQPWCLRSGIDQTAAGAASTGFDVKRMRAAYANGTILLVVSARSRNTTLTNDERRNVLFQFASDDLGASFDLVEQTDIVDQTSDRGRAEVVVVNGQFFVFYLAYNHGQHPCYRKFGTAFQPFTSAEEVKTFGTGVPANTEWDDATHTDGDLAVCVDEDGAIYCFGRMTYNSYGHHVAIRSRDYGQTWEGMGDSSLDSGSTFVPYVGHLGHWFHNSAAGAQPYPKQITACAGLGSAWIFCNNSAGTSTHDNSLGVIQLGGYSTVTMPGRVKFPTDGRRVGWEVNYLPFEPPENSGWTPTGVGAGIISSVDGALDIGTTAVTRYYSMTTPGTPAEGVIVMATLAVPVGGALATSDVALRLETDSGSADYGIVINFTNTGFRVYDYVAGSQVGTDVTCTMATGIQILAEVRGAVAKVWYREGLDPASDREWTVGPATASLTSGGGTGNSVVRFGHLAATTSNSNWYGVHFVTDEYTGEGLSGFTNPDDLFPRTYSVRPQTIDAGLRVAATDGPSGYAERWNIATRYDYEVERALPWRHPSPRAAHRTTGDGSDVYYAFDLGLNTSGQLNAVYGVYIAGANWRYGDVQVLASGGGAWTTTTAVDMATDLASLPYTRDGNTITPDTGTANTAARYIAAGELVGCTVDLGGGTLRKVRWNSEGYWTDTSARHPVILLEDADAADPASGTCSIWSRSAIVLIHKLGNVRGIRLKVRAQDTVEEYLQTSIVFPGPIMVFGLPPGWGRIRSLDANAALVEAEDGSRRSKVLGPPRRSVEFGWPDGVDLRPMQGDGSTPFDDWIVGTSTGAAVPIAAWSDVPLLLEGMLRRLDGPHRPCVYLPHIPKGTPNAVVYTSPERYLYGRLDTSVVAPGVLGDEDRDEVVRVDPTRIVEEV